MLARHHAYIYIERTGHRQRAIRSHIFEVQLTSIVVIEIKEWRRLYVHVSLYFCHHLCSGCVINQSEQGVLHTYRFTGKIQLV